MTRDDSQNRLYELDVAKIIAMLMVAWGHFVSVGTISNGIPLVINPTITTPIIPISSHNLWKVEHFLINNFSVQFGVIGVIVFFLISGYFIPQMQLKYNKNEFSKFNLFFHSMKKIIPYLLFSSLLIMVIEKWLQNISFTFFDLLATCSGIPMLLSATPIIVSIWYISILFFLWIISSVIKEYSPENVLIVFFICLILTLLPSLLKQTQYEHFFSSISFVSRMLTIPLIGVMFYLTKSYLIIDRIIYMFFSIGLSYLTLNLYQELYNIKETYSNINSFIFAGGIIYISKTLYGIVNRISVKAKRIISSFSNLFLPFYLIHVSVGLNVIFVLVQYYNVHPVYAVIGAYIACFGASFFINQVVFYLEKKIKELQNASRIYKTGF